MAMDIRDIIDQAEKEGLKICWVVPGDRRYEEQRKIANSRFSHHPAAIARCCTEESVSQLFKIFKGNAPKLRVRSGGHQHEGMCSADKVLLVDLSHLNAVEFVGSDRNEAWIQPGCRLGDVYEAMWGKGVEAKDRRIFPGGGCPSVNAGGLVQGGGWGIWLRRHGLTCDSLIGAKVVLANGDHVYAGKDDATGELVHEKLFWAIRGGGGGNFGVVTNYRFRLHPFPPEMTRFRLRWRQEHRYQIARLWMNTQAKMTRGLTTFCRLSVVPGDASLPQDLRDEAIIMGGMFFGSQPELQKLLQPFYDIAQPVPYPHDSSRRQYAPVPDDKKNFMGAIHDLAADLQPGWLPLDSLETDGQGAGGANAPTSTCSRGARHPHKVSSAFPCVKDEYRQLARDLTQIVDSTDFDPQVNRYISLHGFGGAVKDKASDATAFPYRNKDFLLQFQAWWSEPENPRAAEYIRWIVDLRRNLEGVEGAFINFPDISLVSDKDRERVQLLSYYYAGNLPELRNVKAHYDRDNVFRFGMSIPPF